MKKLRGSAVIWVVLVALVAACSPADPYLEDDDPPPAVVSLDPDAWTGGVVYHEASDWFDITVYPARLVSEEGTKELVYRLEVDTKADRGFDGFYITLLPDPQLDPYLAAGRPLLPLPKFDMVPADAPTKGSEAKGASAEVRRLLSDEGSMGDAGLEYADIVHIGRNFELWLRWDGGEERLALTTDVIDELGQ
ncbi:MAG: hypothetical protein IPJ61_07045 [Tessaracoccus sp.]|uniref:hypothetical protein n=1 Tax=Tessaracoccus sp. TaxID=1971211 RepID=UPI001EB661FC|nr:hypothetical protein [Tessaracoccus sp.]MBK7820829.1 hypothetical protein [Tessaracoccus sp.]